MGEVAALFAALVVAHVVGDHWVQTDRQACRKAEPGWVGRLFCIQHVCSYTVVSVLALAALMASAGWRPDGTNFFGGLAVSAVTHYVADRRWPLRWLAERTGKRAFWTLGAPRAGRDDNPSIGTGAYALDQSWHVGWLFVAALIIAA